MAYDIDHTANFLWNDLVGPYGYAYPRPAFYRYPRDIEYGLPNLPPAPRRQSQLCTRHQVEIESESDSEPSSQVANQQQRPQSQPSNRSPIEIESNPDSGTRSPEAPQQQRPQSESSNRRQIEIESPPPPTSSKPAEQNPPPSVPPSTNAPTGKKDATSIYRSIQNRLCGGKLNIGVWTVLFLLVVIGIFFAVLGPKSPEFRLDDVTIYNFTATGATLGYRLDATISSRNPNHIIGIQYRRLEAYVVYGPERVTDPMTPLIPGEFDLGRKYSIVMTASLSGESVLSPATEVNMAGDLNEGAVRLELGLKGRLKWKVGSWNSTWWYVYVSCPANIRFQNPNTGVQVGDGLRFPLGESCFVETVLGR